MKRAKILLLIKNLNGYDNELIEALKEKYEVEVFRKASKIGKEFGVKERIIRSLVKDFKVRIFNRYLTIKEKEIYIKHIENLSENYDYIFDFGGRTEKTCIELLKEKYKRAKYKLYIWDDLKYSNNPKKISRYFDDVYIFNKEEAEENNFKYRANFFSKKFGYGNENKEIDIFYRGSYRGEKERVKVLEAVDKSMDKKMKDIKVFVKKSFFRDLYFKIFGKKYITQKYETIDSLADSFKRSKIVIDIAFKNQKGIGLRPIEAIGSNSKLITTNENIKKYEFYNENNIFVLKRDLSNAKELEDFFKKEYIEISEEIKKTYSIDGFIEDIFKN